MFVMTMETTVKILQTYGAIGVQAVKSDIDRISVSGKSRDLTRFEVTSKNNVDTLIIFGAPYLETGRGPRQSSETSNFLDNIDLWVQDKFPGESPVKQRQLAKFFRYRINKEGDATFKKGGRKVYSDTLDKLVEEIKAEVRKDFHIQFTNMIKNSWR